MEEIEQIRYEEMQAEGEVLEREQWQDRPEYDKDGMPSE